MQKLIFIFAIFLLSFNACNESTEDSPSDFQDIGPVSESKAIEVSNTIEEIVDNLSDNQSCYFITRNTTTKTSFNVNESYYNDKITITGTISGEKYSLNSDLTITFNNYEDADGTKIDGYAHLVTTVSDTTLITGYDGTFQVVYQDENYSLSWDYDFSVIDENINSSGSFSVNGETYDYSYNG